MVEWDGKTIGPGKTQRSTFLRNPQVLTYKLHIHRRQSVDGNLKAILRFRETPLWRTNRELRIKINKKKHTTQTVAFENKCSTTIYL